MCERARARRHRPGGGVAGAGVAGGDALDPRRRRRLPAAARRRRPAAAEASGDDAALATVYTTRAMLAALRGDRRGNARAYQHALPTPSGPATSCRSCASAPTAAATTPRRAPTRRRSPSSARRSRSPSWSAPRRSAPLAYSNRGDTYMRMGRLDDALRDLRRAKGIWERLGSELVDYAIGQLGDVQALRGQRSDALALYRQAIETGRAARRRPGARPGADRHGPRARRRRPRRRRRRPPSGPSTPSQSSGSRTRILAAGWVELRRGDRTRRRRAGRRGAAARPRPPRPPGGGRGAAAPGGRRAAAVGGDRRGGRPPVARPRQPDRRGPRRPAASPRRATGRARDDAAGDGRAAAVRRRRVGLPGRGPAGRVGARRRLADRHLDARRVPRHPRRHAGRGRRLGIAQGPRPRQAARRPARAHRSCATRWRRCCGPTSRTARRAGCRCC